MWSYTRTDELYHYGVLGMKWGVRRKQNKNNSLTKAGKQHLSQEPKKASALSTLSKTVYSIGAKLNPREISYAFRKLTNNPNNISNLVSKYTTEYAKKNGVLPTDSVALKAVETMGIKKHSETKYDNLTDEDIGRLKTYTDSARYSRGINGFLAIGEPKEFAKDASELKATLSKNKINDTTVYRSCNYKFSTNGLSKKLDTLSESELANMFASFSKKYNGKKLKENRVFSTSTSPLFAIDTWRAVNPTAASTYNTYMIINCKGTSGVFADAKTTTGKSLVNTHSNQEAILAPSKLQYKKLEYDKERGMFAITVDALGDEQHE